MDAKRIYRFRTKTAPPIVLGLSNQFGEEYSLDVSVNILFLVDTGRLDDRGRTVWDVGLAVSYASYPVVSPRTDAPTGDAKRVPFSAEYGGLIRVECRDRRGVDCVLDVVSTITQVVDRGLRDEGGKTQFDVEVAQQHNYVDDGVPTSPPPIVDGSSVGSG